MAAITTRFEVKIPPDKRAQYEAAAKDAKMSLSAWMQQAADHELDVELKELIAFRREWAERFGILASSYSPYSIESIDEVACEINKRIEGEKLLIEALQSVWQEFTERQRVELSNETESLVRAALESIGRL